MGTSRYSPDMVFTCSSNFRLGNTLKNASLIPRHQTSTRKKLAPTAPDGRWRAATIQPMPRSKRLSVTWQANSPASAASMIRVTSLAPDIGASAFRFTATTALRRAAFSARRRNR